MKVIIYLCQGIWYLGIVTPGKWLAQTCYATYHLALEAAKKIKL